MKLGTFKMRKGKSASVEISGNDNADGVVTADAVVLVPEKR